MRFAEALRGERAIPSLKRPTRDDDGASGMRSMSSLNRRGGEAEDPFGMVGMSSWEVMQASSIVRGLSKRSAFVGPLVAFDGGASGDGRQCVVVRIPALAAAHSGDG